MGGNNTPGNLITLFETYHKSYHRGEFLLKIKRGQFLKDAAFMAVIRWEAYRRLKNEYLDKDGCKAIQKSQYILISLSKNLLNPVEIVILKIDFHGFQQFFFYI